MIPFGPKPVPENRWFESKPLWARIFIMIAGVVMNIVLAIVVATWIALHYGEVVVSVDGRRCGPRAHARAGAGAAPERRHDRAVNGHSRARLERRRTNRCSVARARSRSRRSAATSRWRSTTRRAPMTSLERWCRSCRRSSTRSSRRSARRPAACATAIRSERRRRAGALVDRHGRARVSRPPNARSRSSCIAARPPTRCT